MGCTEVNRIGEVKTIPEGSMSNERYAMSKDSVAQFQKNKETGN